MFRLNGTGLTQACRSQRNTYTHATGLINPPPHPPYANMATVVQDPPREDQPFTMNSPVLPTYNAAQQTLPGIHPSGDGPHPTTRHQKFNSEGTIPTSTYGSSIYDQQNPQPAQTDHHPAPSSQQPPTQQPTPPQSFINPSPDHIKQLSDDRTPEPADPVSHSSNPETPAPVRQPSQLYGTWQSTKSYGQDPPPSRGSVTQQPGFQSPRNLGGYPSPQPPDSPPINASSSIPMPLSSNPRAVPQSPRYVNSPPNGTQNPVYAKPHIPKEEVCLECAMRDQDMADVDVTSPGAWERDSDVYYNDLVRSEEEAISNDLPLPEDRPRSTGDLLTETNLKVWLSIVRAFYIPTNCRDLTVTIHSAESTGASFTAYESGDVRQSPEVAPRSRDARPRSSYARIQAAGE